jgi:hypothetical protein
MVLGTVRKWLLVFTAILALAACQKSVQRSPTPAAAANPTASVPSPTPSPAPTPASAATVNPAAPVPSPAQRTVNPPGATTGSPIVLTKENAAKAATDNLRGFSNPAGLMALARDGRFMPEDFKIGALGDSQGDDAQADKALATAEHFLSRLVTGSVETKDIVADAQASLSDTLSYGLSRGYQPSSYRIGAVKTDTSGQATATIRLFGSTGTSEGEIYFERVGDDWLIADLQVSLAQMAIARTAPKEKFFPSAYRWLLED